MDQEHIMRKLSAEDLEKQVQTIVRFLGAVHPSLLSKSDFRPCVELRPIPRIPKEQAEPDPKGGKGSNYKLYASLNLWDLDDNSIYRLRKWLMLHNGHPSCLYYSVFTYDNNKKFLNPKTGAMMRPNKIRSESAQESEEIALDFDDIGFAEYRNLVDRFEAMGIHALWVFTGHGYQAHILLEESLSEKNLLKQFVYKFRSKGFNCDPTCVDPARVMRLPGTFNCKCFTDKHYASELDNPPACELVLGTTARYSLKSLMDKLDSLPTVSQVDEDAFEGVYSRKRLTAEERDAKETPVLSDLALKPRSGVKVSESTKDSGDTVSVKKVEYPYISEFELPEPVERMLAYVPHGLRNKTLGFLIKFFRTQYRLGKNQLLEILQIWAKYACDPPYDADEFKDDFSRLYYKYQGLGYDPALVKRYGPIDFSSLIQLRKQDIHIPNGFFMDFHLLDSAEVRAYLAIKILEHTEEETTIDKIAEVLNVSTRNLRPVLQSLTSGRHCYVVKGVRKQKIPNTYHTNRIVSTHDGFMPLSYNDVRAYVNELCEQGSRTRANGELKLYLFMRWKFYSGDIFMSQRNLGRNIGVEQNAISYMIYRMQEKHFLKVKKSNVGSFMESCEYILLR